MISFGGHGDAQAAPGALDSPIRATEPAMRRVRNEFGFGPKRGALGILRFLGHTLSPEPNFLMKTAGFGGGLSNERAPKSRWLRAILAAIAWRFGEEALWRLWRLWTVRR